MATVIYTTDLRLDTAMTGSKRWILELPFHSKAYYAKWSRQALSSRCVWAVSEPHCTLCSFCTALCQYQ